MSTLKTHNLQSSDSGSVNIALAPNAGMVVTGISTFSNDIVIPDKIIHSGDTNTAIRFPAADTITAETNGAERLRITSAGNVGINTTVPSALLNVNTQASGVTDAIVISRDLYGMVGKLTNSTGALTVTSNKQLILQSDPSSQFTAAGSFIAFETDGTEKVRIRNDGNVGIGTDNPVVQLHILSSSSGLKVQRGNESFSVNANYSGESHCAFELTNALSIRTGSGAQNERFRITNTGNIGIGYTVPNAKLHIASGTSSAVGDATNPALQIGSTSNYRFAVHTTNEQAIIANKNGDDGIAFHTKTGNGAGAFGEALKINSDGYLTLNNITRPTVGHTGNEPIINGFSGYFYNEVHRCITDMRSLCEGTHAGYILLVPAWPGSNTSGKKFYGTITCDRGNTGGGNSTQVAKIHASTAYNNDKFYVEVDRHSQYICGASKVTYGGVAYLAVRFNSGGGGPTYRTYVDGKHRGTDANFLRVVREGEVTVNDKHYGSLATNNAGPPMCGMMVTGMTGSTFDGGTLSSGTVRYQYAPSGQNSPYNSSDGTFTARVNGIYLVYGALLVQHNTGRLEGALQWYNGSSWATWVNFNGTGTTYDGPSFTCTIPLKEGYALKMHRESGNAYNSAHSNHYFGVHLLCGLERDDVII